MAEEIIISLCDLTGNMVRPWAEAGYTCYTVDLQHPPGETREGNVVKVGADVTTWKPPAGVKVKAVFGFPPCTDLAVSGARHFRRKGLRCLIDALTIVEATRKTADETGAPYFIENPVSTLSSYWRPPDFMFHPHQYGGYLPGGGDAYTKKTCLWTGGGFRMPEHKAVEPTEGSKMHRLPPSPERANLRSATPMGFALAVYEANK